MRTIIGLILLVSAMATHAGPHHGHGGHPMQHGFILAVGDSFASHLVADGHHSRQVEVGGVLSIESDSEYHAYKAMRGARDSGNYYFLLQAQNLDLPGVKPGDVLVGHIIRMEVGKYQPKNPVVAQATFKIKNVLLNVENPFFGTPDVKVSKTCDLECECLKVCEGSQCYLCGQW